MNVNLLYFSSTGNTKLLAEHTADWLESRGIGTAVHEALKSDLSAVFGCDLLLVLYPVWGSDMPEPLKDCFERVGDDSAEVKRPSVALLGNCGVFTGDTGVHWKKKLEKLGWEVVCADHVLMPININIPGFNLWRVPAAERRDEIVARGLRGLERILAGILAGERRFAGRGPLDRLGGWSQRAFYEPVLQTWKDRLAFLPDRCARCGLCSRMCPTGNITLDDDGVHFGDDCIFCMKCFNLCPAGAVIVGFPSRDRDRYRRYKGPTGKSKPVLYR